MMKKNYWRLLVLVIVALLAWLIFKDDINRYRHIKKNEAYAKQEQQLREALKEQIEQEEQKKGASLSFDEVLALLPKSAAKRYRAAAAFNQTDIAFYGKVVDQYGQPVSDARIRMSFGASGLSGGTQGITHTDADGRFKVHTVGSSLSIYRIAHPETSTYKRTYTMNGYRNVGNGIHFHTLKEPNWRYYQKPEKPYLFNVWRYGEPEEVKRLGKARVIKDPSEWVEMDLLKDELYVGNNEQGHMRIRAYAEPTKGEVDEWGKPIWRYPRDWWVEIEPVAGASIQEASYEDVYYNLAPESGYSKQVIRFEGNKDDKPYSDRVLEKHYYIKADDGSYYGYIYIRRIKPITRSFNFSIDYDVTLNLNGSRNLEYWKDKNK